eukprot:3934641-Rhodomonas_salina.1
MDGSAMACRATRVHANPAKIVVTVYRFWMSLSSLGSLYLGKSFSALPAVPFNATVAPSSAYVASTFEGSGLKVK